MALRQNISRDKQNIDRTGVNIQNIYNKIKLILCITQNAA